MSLKELQILLKTRPAAYINISATDGNTIRNNVYFKDLSTYNNDISVLLQEYSKDYEKVIVTPRLRNGTSSRAYKSPLTVILKGAQQVATTEVVMQTNQPQMTNGGNFMGLNAPQILDAFSAQRENTLLRDQLQNLQVEYAATKADRDKLVSELHEVRRKNDLYDYHEKNDKPGAIDKLIEAIAGNPSTLTSIAAMIGSRGGAPLNAAQPVATHLEGNKGLLQQVAEEHPEGYCALYIKTINRMNTDNVFAELIKNELKKETENE